MAGRARADGPVPLRGIDGLVTILDGLAPTAGGRASVRPDPSPSRTAACWSSTLNVPDAILDEERRQPPRARQRAPGRRSRSPQAQAQQVDVR